MDGSWSSFPSFMSGLAVTVTSGIILLILSHFSKWLSPKPKLYWYQESFTSGTTNNSHNQNFGRLVIDNIGRGSAENIAIRFSKSLLAVSVERAKITGKRSLCLHSKLDESFKREDKDDITRIFLKKTSGKTRIEIIFFNAGLSPAKVQSVSADDAEMILVQFPNFFLAHRDMLARVWEIYSLPILILVLLYFWQTGIYQDMSSSVVKALK